MKKAVSIALCLAVLLALCACGAAPAKPIEPVINSAVEIAHYASYGEIYDAMEKSADRDETRGSAAMKTDAVSENAQKSADTAADTGYSTTNVQVEGIDEGDIVKTDGKYIYALHENNLVVFKADGKSTAKLTSLKLGSTTDENSTYSSELYLSGDRLVVVMTRWDCYCYGTANMKYAAVDVAYNDKSRTSLSIYDISNPAAPKQIASPGQDGSFRQSRMADGKIYLISEYGVYSDVKRDDEENYVPCTYEGEKATKMPADSIAVLPRPSSSYAVVCAYDVQTGALSGTLSVLGGCGEIYMNSQHLYLIASEYSDQESAPRTESVYTIVDHSCSSGTTVTCIDIATLAAISCGKVPGTVENNYSADEYNGNLRIATTNNTYSYSIYTDKSQGFENYKDGGDQKTANALYVLDSGMNIIGRAENIAPDEYIQSVRYYGDIAYVCTFKQTDPLFAYDLSNPAAPVKLSELKITGFSEYLHPWEAGRLFGLGNEATEDGAVNGLKMVMFNTSDNANVTALKSLAVPADYSPALFDANALLIDHDRNLIGVPTDSGYFLYSYTDDAGFNQLAKITQNADWNGNMRGLYIGNDLYVLGESAMTVIEISGYTTVSTLTL